MEDAKRRGALCQSSAGSCWSCLPPTEEQPGQSPGTEAGLVQSRAVTQSSCQALPLGGALGFGVGAHAPGGWVRCFRLWSGVCGACWGISSALARLTQGCCGSGEQTGGVLRDSRYPSLLLPLNTPAVVVTHLGKQIWQAPGMLCFPFWEETIKFHGVLNDGHWRRRYSSFRC